MPDGRFDAEVAKAPEMADFLGYQKVYVRGAARMTDPKPAQRDVMRLLYKEQGGDRAAVVAAYAKAEAEGRVIRDSNEHKLDATAYAEALYADGVRKGWIA